MGPLIESEVGENAKATQDDVKNQMFATKTFVFIYLVLF